MPSCDHDGQVRPAATLPPAMAVGLGHCCTVILLPGPLRHLQLAPVPEDLTCNSDRPHVQQQPALPAGLVWTRLNCAARAASVSLPSVDSGISLPRLEVVFLSKHPVPLQNKRRASFPHRSRELIGNLQSMLRVAVAKQ